MILTDGSNNVPTVGKEAVFAVTFNPTLIVDQKKQRQQQHFLV